MILYKKKKSSVWTGYLVHIIIIVFLHSQPESKGDLTKVDAASGGAADDVDLEVQRLLSVYDLVKDQESIRYVVRFSLEFISMWFVKYFVLWEEISSWHSRPGLSFNLSFWLYET